MVSPFKGKDSRLYMLLPRRPGVNGARRMPSPYSTLIWCMSPWTLAPWLSSYYSPTYWDYHSTDLVNFSLFFTLSDHFRLWTVRRFSMRTHLSHAFHHFTNTHLPHGEPCFIKPNFILDSSFLCCAWLCYHTHVLSSCSCFSSILPLPCGCIMLFISAMPALDSIGRSDTNMYILYASI